MSFPLTEEIHKACLLVQINVPFSLISELLAHKKIVAKNENIVNYNIICVIIFFRKDNFMTKLILPDYNNSIVNLACSIRKYFDLNYNHNTLKIVDDILEEKKPKNVVVILFDGMGSKLLKEKLNKKSFLLKHLSAEISSVVPSTTTASTTSMLTGFTPKEHGWLGWDIYIKPIDKIVTMFTNEEKDTHEKVSEESVSKKYFPYNKITDLINHDGKYYANIISPYEKDSYDNIDDMFNTIRDNLNKKEKNYIYGYYINPDEIMHMEGTDSENTTKVFQMVNQKVEEFSLNLKDTLLIVVADHGHINSSEIVLSHYKDIFDLLDGNIWLEGRMTTFKIKQGKAKEFEKLFNKYFSNDFILKTKEEVINENLFGTGKETKYFMDSLGDYFALAIGDKYFKYNNCSHQYKSNHAGFTYDEMKIPLIIIDKTNKN